METRHQKKVVTWSTSIGGKVSLCQPCAGKRSNLVQVQHGAHRGFCFDCQPVYARGAYGDAE